MSLERDVVDVFPVIDVDINTYRWVPVPPCVATETFNIMITYEQMCVILLCENVS